MASLRFDPQAPVIVLYVTLKGRITQTLRMALGTGATYIMIPWEIAEALGYEPEHWSCFPIRRDFLASLAKIKADRLH
jgi:predicted aspartyl protease